MQSIVEGEHMRQQARTGPPALDRAGWQRRLREASAARASHAGPNDPVHDKAARCPAADCLQTVRGGGRIPVPRSHPRPSGAVCRVGPSVRYLNPIVKVASSPFCRHPTKSPQSPSASANQMPFYPVCPRRREIRAIGPHLANFKLTFIADGQVIWGRPSLASAGQIVNEQ